MPKASQAIEWVANPSLQAGYEYNDNISLVTSATRSVSATTLTANLDLGARQEIWDLWGVIRLQSRRYADRNDQETDSRSGNLRYEYRAERSVWSLKGSYADDSTLNSATIDADVGKDSKRTSTNINPAWSRSLTETTQLSVNYQYLSARYEDGIRTGLLDYQQQAVNLTVSDQLTSRTSVYAILGYSTFEVTTTPDSQITTRYTSTSQTNTAQLGISYDFTETLTGSLSGGPRKTISEAKIFQSCGPGCVTGVPESSTSYGSVYEVNLKSRLELTSTTISFSRGLDPSGSGSEVQSDNLYVGIDRQLTPDRLSMRVIASGYKFEALDDTSSSLNRNYYRLEPSLRWRWTEEMAIDASYRYSRQRYLNATEIASANAIYLTFTYFLPQTSISR